jgi:hypothetical protein
MFIKVQYKNFELDLDPKLEGAMTTCLTKDTATNMIVYLLKISKHEGFTPNRFFKFGRMLRHIFFAMNPAFNEYEKVRLFFEYSNCIINDIPEHEFSKFEEIDIAIYSNIYYLRQATYPTN